MTERVPARWTEWVREVDEAVGHEWFEGWRTPPAQAEGETLLWAAPIRWAVTHDDAVAAQDVSRWLPGLLALTDKRVHLELAVADWAETEAFDYPQVISAEQVGDTFALTTRLPAGGQQRDMFRLEAAYAAHQPEAAQCLLDVLRAGGSARPCVSCGGRIGGQEHYCRHCGREQSLHCSTCGEPIAPQHKFCEHCGSRQESS